MQERGSRREAHLLDLRVDLGVFLDVLVLLREVGLRLVVVVVRDEVLHPVLGEELPELVVELCRERFVMCDDERRFPDGLDYVRDGEGLPRSRHPEQRLEPVAALKSVHQLADRLRLGTLRLEIRPERKCRHEITCFFRSSRL
jgi:hypothetical protein